MIARSNGGTEPWAVIESLFATSKLNGGELFGWLMDVLERVVSGGDSTR